MTQKKYNEGHLLKDTNGKDLKLFGLDYTEMVYIAPNSYTMIDERNNKEEHIITFEKGYFIGKYAVTQEFYEKIMGENPSNFKGKHRPVEYVSWNYINEGEASFLNKLNREIKKEYGDIGMFSLPSEAQWEYAAAGGSQWQSQNLVYAGSNNLHDVGWFDQNSNNQTMPVGLKQPNALGLHDMSGNVWEWCQDYWASEVTALPQNGEPNSKFSNRRALRGGSYFNYRISCRLRNRYDDQSDFRPYNYFNGFRLCFSPVHPTMAE